MFIQIKNLNYSYPNSNDMVLQNLSLDVTQGEVISVLGQSGSGKSTLLRLIAGLEKPNKGSIMINNNVLADEHTFLYPEDRGVGMVFQDYALFPHLTVEKNITYGLNKVSKSEQIKRLQEVLELVTLTGFNRRYPHELSGGQQQRVALARALAPKPSILLLDEPFSNLDTDLKNKIRQELGRIIRQSGITSIFVTHDIEDSRAIADRIVYLELGRIVRLE